MPYYYLYYILIFIIIYAIYLSLFKRKDKSHDEDDAYNRLIKVEGILDYLEKQNMDVSKYRSELKHCWELYNKKDFLDSEYCSDSLMGQMRSSNVSIKLNPQEGNFRVCKKCGQKIYGNFIFCPNCGEPL